MAEQEELLLARSGAGCALASATAALRNEAFGLFNFELDFWPFSLPTLGTAVTRKL